ncbi:MAG: hypothetical protein MSA18_08720, partial [Succinivibrio sp.]|nr:hypothetical protein [Succinivibrio sp.]
MLNQISPHNLLDMGTLFLWRENHAHKLKDFRKHEIDLIMLKRKQIIINTPNLGKIAQSKKPINPISKH